MLFLPLSAFGTVPTLQSKAFLSARYCTSVDLSPDGAAVYANMNFGGNSDGGTRRFDPNTYATVRDFHTGNAPWQSITAAGSGSFWTSMYYEGSLKQIRVSDGSVLANVQVGPWPSFMTSDQSRRHLYVGTNNWGGEAISTIKEFDTTTGTVGAGATLNGGTGNCLMMSPGDQYLYAVSVKAGSQTFYKIASNDMSIVGTLGITGIINPGFSLSPDGSKAYIPDTGAGKVHVLDTATMTQTDLWDCANVRAFWVSPDGTFALATSATTSEIDIGVYDLGEHSISQVIAFPNIGSVALDHIANPPYWDWGTDLRAVYFPMCASGGGVAVLTPEPATLSLLALGGLALLRQRRR